MWFSVNIMSPVVLLFLLLGFFFTFHFNLECCGFNWAPSTTFLYLFTWLVFLCQILKTINIYLSLLFFSPISPSATSRWFSCLIPYRDDFCNSNLEFVLFASKCMWLCIMCVPDQACFIPSHLYSNVLLKNVMLISYSDIPFFVVKFFIIKAHTPATSRPSMSFRMILKTVLKQRNFELDRGP